MKDLLPGDYIPAETVEFPAVHPGQDWHAKMSHLEIEHGKTRASIAHVNTRVNGLEARFDTFVGRFDALDSSISEVKRHLLTLVNNQLVAHAALSRQDAHQRLGMVLSIVAGALSGLVTGGVSALLIRFLR